MKNLLTLLNRLSSLSPACGPFWVHPMFGAISQADGFDWEVRYKDGLEDEWTWLDGITHDDADMICLLMNNREVTAKIIDAATRCDGMAWVVKEVDGRVRL